MSTKPAKKTHIPDSGFLTYCGLKIDSVDTIDLKAQSIEDATCVRCAKADVRRQLQRWREDNVELIRKETGMSYEQAQREFCKRHRAGTLPG